MIRTMLMAATVLATGCSTQAVAGTQAAPAPEAGQRAAVFAGGCFWCMEKPFDKIDGVISTTSGYTGGVIEGPTYEQVSRHKTKHIEALRVVYDPETVDYARLLEVFWHNVDPTQADGQFCDRGEQYRTAVFVEGGPQRKVVERAKAKIAEELGAEVVTEILPVGPFWVAEEYHQDFYKKQPAHYQRYRTGCGRDRRLTELWGDKAGH